MITEILVLKDKDLCSKDLIKQLELNNFKPTEVTDLTDNYLLKNNYSGVIINSTKSCSDIWKEAIKIRRLVECPVLLIIPHIEGCENLIGYDLIDDFVKSPFQINEVICRLNSLINKISMDNDNLYYGEIQLQYSKREVIVENKLLNLTQKEFDLLYYLIINKNRVISREELIKKIWQNNYKGNSRTVDTHIKKLRNKLKQLSKREYINTVWGLGYKVV